MAEDLFSGLGDLVALGFFGRLLHKGSFREFFLWENYFFLCLRDFYEIAYFGLADNFLPLSPLLTRLVFSFLESFFSMNFAILLFQKKKKKQDILLDVDLN